MIRRIPTVPMFLEGLLMLLDTRSFRSAAHFAALAAGLLAAGCDSKSTTSIDRDPPDVFIISPDGTVAVSGVGFFVDVEATDESGIDRVELRMSGVVIAVDDVLPYLLFVPAIGEVEGAPLAIEVVAFDEAGNSATDAITANPAARTVTQLTFDTNSDTNPAWSPDGGSLAFQSNRFGQWDVFVMDADGGGEVQLTTNLNDDENPAWTPGGQYIAFDSERAGAGIEADLWRLLVVSGEASAESLTFGNNDDRHPSWSPGGASIAFASDRGVGNQFDVWRIPGTGGTATQLTALTEDDRSPAYAPFDDRIAFSSTLNFATPHIYIRDPSTGNVAPLTGDVGVTEEDPAWSPGGNALLFSRRVGAQSNVWNLVLGRVTPMQTTFGTGTEGDGGAAWSPDGTQIAFHSDRGGNSDVYVLK